jgi:hypothetical protein
MVNSQNGYPANNPALCSSRLVPNTNRRITVRNGPAGDLLLWVAGQFDRRVEDIEAGQLDDWGYAPRAIRGSTEISNHASGTAIDLNAPEHPLAVVGTFEFAQVREIHAILAEANGCVRWGGDYVGRVDEMHFEIVASEARCAETLARLLSSPVTGTTTPDEDDDPMLVPAAADDYVSVPCNGKTALFIVTAFGRKVKILQAVGVKDNQGGKPAYTAIGPLVDVNPDQPGPIAVAPGTRVVQLRYSADHSFLAYCA